MLLKDSSIKSVAGTMKIHQITSTTTGKIVHRKVSCFCNMPNDCDCYQPCTAELTLQATPTQQDTIQNEVHDVDDSLTGRYCVVAYDNKPYPGVINDTDAGEIEVQVMHSIGKNRFFWPMMADTLWYNKENFIGVIMPPEKVTSRHYQLNKKDWETIVEKMELD